MYYFEDIHPPQTKLFWILFSTQVEKKDRTRKKTGEKRKTTPNDAVLHPAVLKKGILSIIQESSVDIMSSPGCQHPAYSSNEITSGAIRKRRQREREQLTRSTIQSQIESFLAESPENAEIFWSRSSQKRDDVTRTGSKRTTSGFSEVSFQLHTLHEMPDPGRRKSPHLVWDTLFFTASELILHPVGKLPCPVWAA